MAIATSFEITNPDASFKADTARRKIRGLLVPWNTPAQTGGHTWVFKPGSLHWPRINYVKLNVSHERSGLPVGVASELYSTAAGLEGVFNIARGPEGDAVLQSAADGMADGLSIEAGFETGDSYQDEPGTRRGETIRVVESATLMGCALTGWPAYSGARVLSVAAARVHEEAEMVAQRAPSYITVKDPPIPYTFDGTGPSFMRDAWMSFHPGDGDDAYEARQRLKSFREFQAEKMAQFATVTRTSAANVVEPGYSPLISDFSQDRPLFAAASKASITNPTAFTLPGNLAEAGIDAAAGVTAEGTNRADNAAPSISGGTVTPVGVQGLFRLTREVVDASNPAIDALLLAELRESYARQTEALIFAELNSVQSGVITAGQVPNGAQARVSAATALPSDLKKAVAGYVNFRGQRPRSVVASSRTAVSEALETLDGSTLPPGSEDMWALNGCGVRLSPQISGVAAGDGDVFILGAGDLWCWSSPILLFEYFERQGPAMVDVALFGYFGTKCINPRGISSIRHT